MAIERLLFAWIAALSIGMSLALWPLASCLLFAAFLCRFLSRMELGRFATSFTRMLPFTRV